jgi:hypothetical protein
MPDFDLPKCAEIDSKVPISRQKRIFSILEMDKVQLINLHEIACFWLGVGL